jgi:hypothetical protein
VHRIALCHARRFQDPHGVVRLAQFNSARALLDLQSKVECQQFEIGHPELHIHLLFEFLDFC